jgi:phage portal protein BeeE
MAWYNNIFNREQVEDEEKLNPAQVIIARDEGFSLGTTENYINYANAYEEIEVVNRAVNMIVDDAADIPVDVGDKLPLEPVVKNIRKSRVDLILNREPNPFQDVNSFKRNLIIDLLIDGNIFIYYVLINKTYKTIYGSISILLFMLLWIYINWIIYISGIYLIKFLDTITQKKEI